MTQFVTESQTPGDVDITFKQCPSCHRTFASPEAAVCVFCGPNPPKPRCKHGLCCDIRVEGDLHFCSQHI